MILLTPKSCRKRREECGLSQAGLSEKAGLQSKNYICRFEKGEFAEPSAFKLNQIEMALADAEKTLTDAVEV